MSKKFKNDQELRKAIEENLKEINLSDEDAKKIKEGINKTFQTYWGTKKVRKNKYGNTVHLLLICLANIGLMFATIFGMSLIDNYTNPVYFPITAGVSMVLVFILSFIFKNYGHTTDNIIPALTTYLAAGVISLLQATSLGNIGLALLVFYLIAIPVYLFKTDKKNTQTSTLVGKSACLIGQGIIVFVILSFYGMIMNFELPIM